MITCIPEDGASLDSFFFFIFLLTFSPIKPKWLDVIDVEVSGYDLRVNHVLNMQKCLCTMEYMNLCMHSSSSDAISGIPCTCKKYQLIQCELYTVAWAWLGCGLGMEWFVMTIGDA